MAHRMPAQQPSQLGFGDLLDISTVNAKPLKASLSAVEAAARSTLTPAIGWQPGSEKQQAIEQPWLCITLPSLSIEVLTDTPTAPQVVSQNQRGRAVVIDANDNALAAGIETGMTIASAHALHDSLTVLEHSPVKEQQRLDELADWLYNFSSQIALQPPNQLLVEMGGSVELFGGEANLLQLLQNGLKQRGHRSQLAQAETPTAARWLCLCIDNSVAGEALPSNHSGPKTSLNQRLGQLPISVLADIANVQQLQQLGMKTLTDVFRLPRAGLARRFGPALLQALDQAKGLQPEALKTHKPALQFEESIELDAELSSLGAFWPLVQTLLTTLTHFAQAHNRCFQTMRLSLEHADSAHLADDEEARRDLLPHTVVNLRLLRPSNHLPRIEPLMHSQLEAVALPAPIRALSLTVQHFMPSTPHTEDALAINSNGHAETSNANYHEWVSTLERLQLRLGQPRLLGLYPNDDHRPEKAWRSGPPTAVPTPAHGAKNTEGSNENHCAPASDNSPQRPNWLLPNPVALTRTQLADLQLISRPERIQSGWWSSEPTARDYFIASNHSGQRLWVFRDDNGWFCHGLFR